MDSATAVLRYGNGAKALGWSLFVGILPIVVFLFWGIWHTPPLHTSPLVIGPLLMAAGPLCLLAEFYRFRVEYDDTMIHVYSPWRRIRAIPWTELTTCVSRHYRGASSYVIGTRGHGKLTFSYMLSGIDEFIALLKAKQSPDDYAASVLLDRPFWRRWGDTSGHPVQLQTRLLWTHGPVALVAAAMALYLFWMVAVFVVNGSFAYHTRLNLGNPIAVRFFDEPLLFIALNLGQLALGALVGGLGVESSYHVVRLLYPSLGWPLHLKFRPFRVAYLLVISAVVAMAIWLGYFAVRLLVGEQ